MQYNFDEFTNREGTHSYKYELRKKIFGTNDVYPMWVADTEFKVPQFIINALQERLNHGIFGYTLIDEDYYQAIINWIKEMHQWEVKKEWIKYSPGVVPSLFASVMAYSKPGDKVIIQSPVYYPFYSAVNETGRKLITNSLKLHNGRYNMDLDDLKSKIDKNTKMLILCSPHNPTGNVWRKDELKNICELCVENEITIIADEIHADIVYEGFKHIPVATLSEEISDNTVTLMAPSKTFNIAGLNTSYIVSSNRNLLKKFAQQIEAMHIGPNIFAIEATKAAYKFGREWLKELMTYYTKNLNFVRDYLKNEIPQIRLTEPEGTFLLWLDFRKLGVSRKELNKLLVNDCKLGLSDGYQFGKEGEGFQRMNIGCQTQKIKEVLVDIKKCVQKL